MLGGALTTSSSAEVLWKAAESVVSSSELSLVFNNTEIAVRDEDGKLHLVWKEAHDIRYVYKIENGTWMIQSLGSVESKTVFKPTITWVGGDTLFVTWSEQKGPNQQRVKFTTSDDCGTKWSTPSWVFTSDGVTM